MITEVDFVYLRLKNKMCALCRFLRAIRAFSQEKDYLFEEVSPGYTLPPSSHFGLALSLQVQKGPL